MTAAQLLELIAQGEGARVEFKSSFQKETIETLAAFANAQGGAVLLGVGDAGQVAGVAIQTETVQGWINQCKQITSPRIIPDIDLVIIDGKTVAVISVGEYPIKPVACKGRYFKRVGNANHQMTATEISDAHIKLINSSWDYHPDPEHALTSISAAKVQAFADALKLNATFDAVLEKFELIKGGCPTFACHLLFSKNDVFLSTIEAGRFASPIIIKDSITSRDTLVEQVQRIMDFMVKHTNKAYIITGNPKRTERWDYPMDALREIIINMIVHRDYRSANDSTIKVFDDRIEFFNPGVLMDDLTVEKIKTGHYKSHLRNKQVASIFRELDLIEKYGSGVRRVIDTFVAYGLPEPEFEATQGGMAVTVFKNTVKEVITQQPESGEVSAEQNDKMSEKMSEKMSGKTSEKVFSALQADPESTIAELAAQVGVTTRTIERALTKLQQENRVARIGADRGGHWKVLNTK
jgi:ATP-dependent DNA helicase RecG